MNVGTSVGSALLRVLPESFFTGASLLFFYGYPEPFAWLIVSPGGLRGLQSQWFSRGGLSFLKEESQTAISSKTEVLSSYRIYFPCFSSDMSPQSLRTAR